MSLSNPKKFDTVHHFVEEGISNEPSTAYIIVRFQKRIAWKRALTECWCYKTAITSYESTMLNGYYKNIKLKLKAYVPLTVLFYAKDQEQRSHAG